MLERIQTFGESLTEWMEEKGLSAASLSVYTRATRDATIARLMHDQLDYQRCARYITELAESYPGIDEETLKRLRCAVDVNRYGKEMYAAQLDFAGMLSGERPISESDGKLIDLMSRLEDWAKGMSFKILCMGVTDDEPLRFLCMVSQAFKDVHIYQFFNQRRVSQLSRLLARTLPMAFNPNYELYSLKDDAGILLNSVMIFRRDDGAQLIYVYDGNEFSIMNLTPGNDLFEFCFSIYLKRQHDARKINCHFTYNCPKAYIDFLSHCLQLETDRAIYQIKSEIGLEYVPVDILYENFAEWTQKNDPRFLPFLDELRDIFALRGENIRTKKEPTTLIMTQNGMKEFAKTGRMKDHPFCMRPFTPNERRRILSALLESAETSNVYPLIFSDENMELDHSFIGYSRECMLVCKAQADYDLANYTEIVLTSEALSGQFADYVVNFLVRNNVLSRRAGLEFIYSLYQCIEE